MFAICLVIFIENMWKDIWEMGMALFCFLGTGQIQISQIEALDLTIFMISGFLGPLGTLICGFEYTELLQNV